MKGNGKMDKENEARLLDDLRQAVIMGDIHKTEKLATDSIKEGTDLLLVLEEGLGKGIETVGDLFGKGEIFLPELMGAAYAMEVGTTILVDELKKKGIKRKSLGVIVIGTAAGDIHDIGKTIVATLLTANGFEVYDLGTDVSREIFVEKVREYNADIVGISSLLTTTMPAQEEVITALSKANLRAHVKVMVGGAPVTLEWAEQIGADAYAVNAAEAVIKARELMGFET